MSVSDVYRKESKETMGNGTKNERIFKGLWETVSRAGVAELLEWIEGTDFYSAPCSTKYHLSREGGLVEHSVNVYDVLQGNVYSKGFKIGRDSQIICALGHDLCKADFYDVEMRNKKENGKWVQRPFYNVKDKFPYGHGEKSVLILSRFLELTVEEQMAIRWHMGGFTAGIGDYSVVGAWNEAVKFSALVPLLHMADFESTNLVEVER